MQFVMRHNQLLRFFAGVLILVGLGWGALYAVQYNEHRAVQNERERYNNALAEWESKSQEDTYGGKTPEETLQLFIDALKAGDTELASKYFVLDEQEKQLSYFEEQKKKGNLKNIIAEASKLQPTKETDGKAFFVITNKDNVVEVQVVVGKNEQDIWKIIDL